MFVLQAYGENALKLLNEKEGKERKAAKAANKPKNKNATAPAADKERNGKPEVSKKGAIKNTHALVWVLPTIRNADVWSLVYLSDDLKMKKWFQVVKQKDESPRRAEEKPAVVAAAAPVEEVKEAPKKVAAQEKPQPQALAAPQPSGENKENTPETDADEG